LGSIMCEGFLLAWEHRIVSFCHRIAPVMQCVPGTSNHTQSQTVVHGRIPSPTRNSAHDESGPGSQPCTDRVFQRWSPMRRHAWKMTLIGHPHQIPSRSRSVDGGGRATYGLTTQLNRRRYIYLRSNHGTEPYISQIPGDQLADKSRVRKSNYSTETIAAAVNGVHPKSEGNRLFPRTLAVAESTGGDRSLCAPPPRAPA